jgi:hypothetical protein
MSRVAGAVVVSLLLTIEARAEPNYAVWSIAHERMMASWRRAEPRCGWTVGGYTCGSRSRMHTSDTRLLLPK